MNRLLAALALATVMIGNLFLAPSINAANAKANLTTVSYISSAPAVVAPVGQSLPKYTPILPAKAKVGKPAPPVVIRDLVVERERARANERLKEKVVVNRIEKTTTSKAVSTNTKTYTRITARTGRSSSTNWATPGQCTWGAQIKWRSATGWYLGGFHGNAKDWAYRAASAGHSVGSTPRARSVVVMQPGVHGSGSAGHVAWVINVSGSKVTYVEMNGMAGPFNWSTRTVSHTGGMRYIYAP